jgi:hypothetical protein
MNKAYSMHEKMDAYRVWVGKSRRKITRKT